MGDFRFGEEGSASMDEAVNAELPKAICPCRLWVAGQGRWRAPSAGKIRQPDERFFCGEKPV